MIAPPPSARRRHLRRFALLGVLVGAGGLALGAPRAASAAPDALERALEDEIARQQTLLGQAKTPAERTAVASRYANRVGRDPSAMNEFLHGRALFYADDKPGARAAMLRALSTDATFWPARVRLAMLERELGRRADAEREARRVLDQRPTSREALDILAGCAYDARDWDRTIEWLRRLVALSPGDLLVRRKLAVAYVEKPDFPAAERELSALRQAAPEDLEIRHILAVVWLKTGRTDAAIGLLESVVHEQPASISSLQALIGAYETKEDWTRLRSTLERILPYLSEEGRTRAQAAIEELRKGPPQRVARPAGAAPVRTFDDVLRDAQGPDARGREDAMIQILDACRANAVPRLTAAVLRRVTVEVEPSASVRAIVVRILGHLAPEQVLPLLAIALYDPEERVRMIAAETLGRVGHPAGLAYLFPLLDREGDSVAEYQAIRSAIRALTDFEDLPAGVHTVAPEGVAASKEAWRRWSLSEASVEAKLKAIRGLAGLREPWPERQLGFFVRDAFFEVMQEAYVAMRAALRRPLTEPIERKMFPLFPDVPDAELTRSSMRAIQDRVTAWEVAWAAERRAFSATTAPK